MKSMKYLIHLLCLGMFIAAPLAAEPTKNTAPYIKDLYTAIVVQSEATLANKAASKLWINEYYKGKLAEYVALMKAQQAGYTKKSDVYAQALFIANLQENPAAVRMLQQRYEQCQADEQYDILNPATLNAGNQVPTYLQMLYAAVSIQVNASTFSIMGSLFVSNAVYKAKLAEFAAIQMGLAAGAKNPSDLYAQAIQIANVINDPGCAGALKHRYEASIAKERSDEYTEIATTNATYYGLTKGAIATAITLGFFGLLHKMVPQLRL